MPLYYFHVTNAGSVTRDGDGTELAGFEEARREAVTALCAIAKDELPDGDSHEFMIDVRDSDGRSVLTVSLSVRVERCLEAASS